MESSLREYNSPQKPPQWEVCG